jgi:HK97 family phage major capsid protein
MAIKVSGVTYRDEYEARQRLEELDREHAGAAFPDKAKDEWNELNTFVLELETRREAILERSRRPGNTEAGATFHHRSHAAAETADQHPQARESRDAALRTIERCVNEGELTSEAADRVDRVLRGPDAGLGLDAAYIRAAGEPAYERAFAKLLRYSDGAGLRMAREEQEAVQAVNRAEEMRTALTSGSGAGGGFAIPITIDPTVNLSSNGAINPIRQLADVRTMATRELRLVTSDGVVAQYQAEAAEALDNAPVLAQPVLTAQRATSFIPFSFELDQDWSTVAAELARLVADAKDVLEASKFLTGAGSGSNEPVGVLSIGTGALTTTQRVQTDVAATLDIDDVWDIKGQVGNTRFATQATWTANPGMLDRIYRFTPSGSTTEPQAMPTREGPLCGRPTAEWSTIGQHNHHRLQGGCPRRLEGGVRHRRPFGDAVRNHPPSLRRVGHHALPDRSEGRVRDLAQRRPRQGRQRAPLPRGSLMAAKVLQAKSGFTCEVDGQPLIVRTGEPMAAGHPVVKGREGLFETVEPKPDVPSPPKRRRRA